MPGQKTTLLDPENLVDALIGNRNGNTVQVLINSVATQMVNDGAVREALDTLQSQMTTGVVLRQSWGDLMGIAPAAAGTGGEVIDADTGTHLQATATGYDGVVVPNAGRYSWSLAWMRWVRLGDTGLSSKADQSALEAEELARASADADLADRLDGASGPSTGWAQEDLLLSSVALDATGRVLNAAVLNGPRQLYPGADGRLRDDALTEDGPSAGWLDPLETAPVQVAETGPEGSLLRFRGADGVLRVPVAPGRFGAELSDLQGPSAGWLEEPADSLAEAVTTDMHGVVVAARAAGSLWQTVSYVAGPSGLARHEVAADVALARRTGTTLVVPPARIRRGTGWLNTPAWAFDCPAPASEAVSEPITLVNLSEFYLSYQNTTDFVVTRVSDGAVLTLGVDYRVVTSTGVIAGLMEIPSLPVTVTFTGHKIRQDVVSIDPITMAMVITAGPEVRRAASMWPPALPAGHVPLFRVFRSVSGMDVSPIYLYRNRVRTDRAREIEADIAEQRRRARAHRRIIQQRVTAGTPLKWGGYGDSITALGTGTLAETNTLPNGPRQRISYFTLYDTATRALIPTFDLSDGRGATYVREGFNWRALKHLQRVHGATTDFRNWGIGGTNSTDTVNETGTFNMRHPDRLAAVVADDCDIVLFSPGMNELGQTYTYANVRAICEALLAGGAEVILLPSCRTNTFWVNRNAAWLLTCGQIRQVADDLGLPYCDTTRLYDPAQLGALGLSEAELCDATLRNHPGKRELDAMGDLVVELL